MTNLNLEEQEILEAFESDRLTRTENWQEELEQHKQIASATFAQNSTINISVSEKDLRSLQKRALVEGVPYPLFISSILHKFIEGKLVEISWSHLLMPKSDRPYKTEKLISLERSLIIYLLIWLIWLEIRC